MKAAPFALDLPDTLAEAGAMAAAPDAWIMAGGQSLGPMLHLRLAQPARVVAVGGLAELSGVAATEESLTIGAAITHAAIADGRLPPFHNGILVRIAEGIAYRAVRNRGTIGGSLCHADPAADWLTTLTALGADLLIRSGTETRIVALRHFVTGAFRTVLTPGEILWAVRLTRPSVTARWAYLKACRKPGEFAHAMAAVLLDPDRGVRRAVIGATGGPPVILDDADVAPEAVEHALASSGLDPVARHIQAVILRRALAAAAT